MRTGRPIWKKLRILLIICLVLFIALQFIRPPLDNPPVVADLSAPPEVKAILRRACYDCHSNETHLAWFDQPAPAYWMVVEDVKQARKALNFSGFDSLPKGVQAAKLFECIMQVEQGAMPLSQYTLLHRGGVVSAAEMEVLKKYAVSIGYHAKVDTARQRAWAEQWAQWTAPRDAAAIPNLTVRGVTPVAQVKDEYNGIAYGPLAGFANWKAVSTTERFDNGTFRLILGNDITIKAIREGHTNPWPDGATFAKVAWDQLPDSSGIIHAGAFRQVEFMIRDGQKYSTTGGWGWARWVGGLAMKPYGHDASFPMECINCHKPMQPNDQTFTIPLADTLALKEVDSDTLRPMMGKVITTVVHQREGTMSTLYGNDVAVKDARAGKPYSAGAVVTLVTWEQRDDPHWFGGRIPGEGRTEEVVSYLGSGPVYKGKNTSEAPRISYIAGLKAAVLP